MFGEMAQKWNGLTRAYPFDYEIQRDKSMPIESTSSQNNSARANECIRNYELPRGKSAQELRMDSFLQVAMLYDDQTLEAPEFPLVCENTSINCCHIPLDCYFEKIFEQSVRIPDSFLDILHVQTASENFAEREFHSAKLV